MLKIRQVNEQQINAALNDIDKSISTIRTEAEAVKKNVAEESENTQKVIEGLSEKVDQKLTDLDSAIGDNIEYLNENFVPNTRTINDKPLSEDIVLTASDVGAATVNDITNAINGLDASSVGGDGKYIKTISETNGIISATEETMDTTPTANSTKAVTSGGVKSAIDTAESNAKNLANATGTLPVANGGTGATTGGGACTNLIGALTVATGDVTDNTDIITSNADGYAEQSDKTIYKRKGIRFWNYIKDKISSVLGLSTTGLSTGTITTTGDIHVGKGKSIIADGTKANYSMIKFKDNTGDEYGNGVVIGGGGAVVIGGGESADAYYSGASLSAGSETMAVTNDGAINFVSNLQDGYASGRVMTMGTDGKLTNTYGFVGPITGNVTGNVSGSAGSCAEANLTWGGRNWAGGNGPLDTAIVDNLRANRYAGIRAGVTVEYSRDGGSTWTSYGASTQSITQLFTTSSSFVIGKADSTNKATANGTKYQLRITIDHSSASVYSEIRKYVLNVSTNGSYSCTVDIQRTLKQSPDTWANYMTGVPLSGWSGYNVIQTAFTAGYSFDNQFRKVRFIFKANGGDTNYTGLNVLSIYAYGGFGWNTPTNLARNGHLYSIDVASNGTLTAGMNINGNATTATTANRIRTSAPSSPVDGDIWIE